MTIVAQLERYQVRIVLTKVVLKAAKVIAPQWAERKAKQSWYAQRAETYQRELSQLQTLDAKISHVRASADFGFTQKITEIRSLLERVQALGARRVLEIGTFEGGTLALLAQVAAPDARILSLDINYYDYRLHSYPRLARARQVIKCINADTHRRETLAAVNHWLGKDRLDVLFIDGDHSYEGVKADFEMYSPLVRTGGLIAFHDIHPDYRTRYGRPTEADVGDVPRYWQELRAGRDATDLIEDEGQDGMGIGVLYQSGGVG